MCQKHSPKRIDKCMRKLIENLNLIIDRRFIIKACCCGHKKYPMTIVVCARWDFLPTEYFDLISGTQIPRKTRFYKKDKKGYYYIPEILKTTETR